MQVCSVQCDLVCNVSIHIKLKIVICTIFKNNRLGLSSCAEPIIQIVVTASLVVRGFAKAGETVLIHGGTGGVSKSLVYPVSPSPPPPIPPRFECA